MQSDFAVFRAHLAEACRKRKMSHDPFCAAAVDLHFAGVRALDIYRLAQIADHLDVIVDWLLGRSERMELTKVKEKAQSAQQASSETVEGGDLVSGAHGQR